MIRLRGYPYPFRLNRQFLAPFTTALLQWYAGHTRPMPWKGERDPYLIWLSEIVLQQTRVAQGMPYFERLKAAYPTVKALADAPEDELLKHWEGLGYYSRARNLHAAAKYVAYELDGRFPATHADILALKGVGAYTAAAIASFAYGLPHAVVDGNVYRVLARVFGIATPIDTTAGKKEFAALAQRLLDERDPGRYNQAIMDFGATVCTPKRPACASCPLREQCVALREGRVGELPVKAKQLKSRTRFFHYLVLRFDGQLVLRKRPAGDVWQGLYDFPLVESDAADTATDTVLDRAGFLPPDRYTFERRSMPYRQTLSHQKIVGIFYEIRLAAAPQPLPEGAVLVSEDRVSDYAFPKIVDRYLHEQHRSLSLF